ncbi:MBL fold hydrolase [Candidatus Marinamargulisbacteria bacterium SCGC AG-343-D04]|nr:MBL fold hydrolase [Candidatus Marinamargulisbacteria bacterium SCGC AG-343-D04]
MTATIYQFFNGNMDNCQYVIADDETQCSALVDPAWDVPFLLDNIQRNKLTLSMILLTHGHFDHVEGVGECLDRFKVPVYMSSQEMKALRPQGIPIQYTEDNEEIQCGNIEIRCLHTPGHSPGGQCFEVDQHLITGDTLFVDGCGRCDLQGSDVEDMYQSLERLKTLPDETIICPGHNYGPSPTDTLENQKKTNRFLTCDTKEDFIRKRMKTK